MANTLSQVQSTVVGGLGTQTYTVVAAGLYTVEFKCFMPYQAAGSSADSSVTTGGSQLQVVVNQNGSAKLTVGGSGQSPTAAILGSKVVLLCASGDVITVVLSSAAAADQGLNAIKSIINVYQGE